MAQTEIQYEEFVVDETPYCFWDPDTRKRNLEFLSFIDAKYFFHIASTYKPQLDSEGAQYAATALRAVYSQGLETLFALLCALTQSPLCVLGWMLKYENGDLFKVVKKIDSGVDVMSRLNVTPVTWEALSSIVLQFVEQKGSTRAEETRKGFAYAWSAFAHDFLSTDFTAEYNSLKHGLRVNMGGSQFWIGEESIPGTPAPMSAMESLGGSDFGSTFFRSSSVSETKSYRHNFHISSSSRNWNPQRYFHSLMIIGISIQNITSALKIMNGIDGTEVSFAFPNSELGGVEYLYEPWKHNVEGVTVFNFDSRCSIHEADLLTKETILTSYKR